MHSLLVNTFTLGNCNSTTTCNPSGYCDLLGTKKCLLGVPPGGACTQYFECAHPLYTLNCVDGICKAFNVYTGGELCSVSPRLVNAGCLDGKQRTNNERERKRGLAAVPLLSLLQQGKTGSKKQNNKQKQKPHQQQTNKKQQITF